MTDYSDAVCLADGHAHATREEEAICSLRWQLARMRAERDEAVMDLQAELLRANDIARQNVEALDLWHADGNRRLWEVVRPDPPAKGYEVTLYTWADDGECIGFGNAANLDLLTAVREAVADEARSRGGQPARVRS